MKKVFIDITPQDFTFFTMKKWNNAQKNTRPLWTSEDLYHTKSSVNKLMRGSLLRFTLKLESERNRKMFSSYHFKWHENRSVIPAEKRLNRLCYDDYSSFNFFFATVTKKSIFCIYNQVLTEDIEIIALFSNCKARTQISGRLLYNYK